MFDFDFNSVKLTKPEDILPTAPIGSGTYVEQNPVYTHAYENSKFPVLLLPQALYDTEGNSIPDGYYMIALSEDRYFLLFIQSNMLKAKVPVIKLEEDSIPSYEQEEIAKLEDEALKYKKKGKTRKWHEAEDKIKKIKLRQEAKMSAEIFDSGKNYYVLKYKNNNVKAEGIIPK